MERNSIFVDFLFFICIISSIKVNNNHIGDEDNIFKSILDFRIKQNFCTFEQIGNKNTKVNHDSVRVRFEVENI